MSSAQISIDPATADDLDLVERLLESNDLPTSDVRDAAPEFVVGRLDDEPVGVGGIEAYGHVGLLRSIVVAEAHRGRGYGAALCDALEARARADGVSTLYLLTTTAAGFFRARGYEAVDREAVPSGIRETSQFTDLCPASATRMRTDLD